MIEKNVDGLRWHEFELLADCSIVHGCFTRHGGQSRDELSSLNLGNAVGDNPDNVSANKEKVSAALAIPCMKSAKISHNDVVTQLDIAATERPLSDGLSTQRVDVGLMVTQADCQAAIIYDPIHHALANIHCGWRGNVQNIYHNAVKHMEHTYGSKAADLLVCISPSLGPDNSEFINYRTELPEAFCEFKFNERYFDLWAISEWQLKEAGILADHIQIARIDTYAENRDYFSFRRSRKSGRQATVCALKRK